MTLNARILVFYCAYNLCQYIHSVSWGGKSGMVTMLTLKSTTIKIYTYVYAVHEYIDICNIYELLSHWEYVIDTSIK